MKSPPTIIDRIPRKARVIVDILLALALLLGCIYARGCPVSSETAKLRRAEKAAMVGQSVPLDRLFMRSEWPYVGYNLLRVGDDGDGVVFYMMRTGSGISADNDVLTRRDKTDGILLTTLPCHIADDYYPPEGPFHVPLLLFVDDPAAVRAVVHLSLPDGSEATMSQVRGEGNPARFNESEWIAGCVRKNIFLFQFPVTERMWQETWFHLMSTNSYLDSNSRAEFPVLIELYDRENQLIRTVDYVIRSRAGDAHAQ